ncbi:MAG: hypothetical protein J6J33_05965 [Clostridia bacterium]|nr:hypothetical protein [Clostridia bacterium]
MANNFVKPIKELGMVLSKKISEAREAGKSFDGSRSWDAKPEEYIVQVMSCDEDEFHKIDGFKNGTLADYKVDKATFDKVKFGSWGKVKFTAQEYNGKITIKPESFTLVEEK